MRLTTTLNKIRANYPCGVTPADDGSIFGYLKLCAHLGEIFDANAPIDILTILDSNGLDDAVWCLRAVDGHDDVKRKLACGFALQMAHLWAMPNIVREYLTTRDGGIRIYARAAANAAWSESSGVSAVAARSAARAAAKVAWDAAWGALWAHRIASSNIADGERVRLFMEVMQ